MEKEIWCACYEFSRLGRECVTVVLRLGGPDEKGWYDYVHAVFEKDGLLDKAIVSWPNSGSSFDGSAIASQKIDTAFGVGVIPLTR